MTRWLLYKKTQTAHVIDVLPVKFGEDYITHCGLVLWPGEVKVFKGSPCKDSRCRHCERYAAKWR